MKIPWLTRRWLQFSLRTLLVFVTLSAIPCSWLAVKLREVKREEVAAAAIENVGGAAMWDGDPLSPARLHSVLGDHFFVHVFFVVLEGDRVTDAALEPLHALNHLQTLELTGASITDAGLKHLGGLRELKSLFLDDTNVGDAGLDKLAGLNQLEELRLGGTNVTDAGLEMLARLSKLQTLVLYNTNVTDAGLEHLRGMKELKFLGLPLAITDAGYEKLQQALPNCHMSINL